MNDNELDRLLHAERDTLPPAVPRDEMWEAIAARRQGKVVPIESARRTAPRLQWAIGVAAVLAIGFALGRTSVDQDAGGPAVATAKPNAPNAALAGATLQHLDRAETFLTGFRMEAAMKQPDPALVTGARDLLSTTRLLLDSPAQSPRMRELLGELENVLVQIAQLQNEPAEDTREFVRQLDEQGVLPRLRVVIPAHAANATIIGES